MGVKVRLQSGLFAHRLTEQEQDIIWNEVNKSVYDDSTPFFTPNDNLMYFVTESSFDGTNCIDIVKANGKTIKIKSTINNNDKKIINEVRKAYKN